MASSSLLRCALGLISILIMGLINKSTSNSILERRNINKRNAPWYCESGTVCLDNRDICFENGMFTEFCHQYYLPKSEEAIGPELKLYYRNMVHSLDYFRLDRDLRRLSLSFTSNARLWTVVHGFTAVDIDSVWITALTDTLVEKGHPVLVYGWKNGSSGPNYLQAAANTRAAGAMLAKVLDNIHRACKLRLDRVTIVGFSLGAHLAGFAGKYLNSEYDHFLGNIIGLDPAGPLFANGNPMSAYAIDAVARLDARDALLVQVLHTNGHRIFSGEAGTLQPMGHLDFYPNGGQLQPGCEDEENLLATFYDSVSNIDFARIFGTVACSHRKAPQILIDSIQAYNSNHTGERSCYQKAHFCKSYGAFLNGSCAEKNKKERQKPIVFGYPLTLVSQRPNRGGKLFLSTNLTRSNCLSGREEEEKNTRRIALKASFKTDRHEVSPDRYHGKLRYHPLSANAANIQALHCGGGFVLLVFCSFIHNFLLK